MIREPVVTGTTETLSPVHRSLRFACRSPLFTVHFALTTHHFISFPALCSPAARFATVRI